MLGGWATCLLHVSFIQAREGSTKAKITPFAVGFGGCWIPGEQCHVHGGRRTHVAEGAESQRERERERERKEKEREREGDGKSKWGASEHETTAEARLSSLC